MNSRLATGFAILAWASACASDPALKAELSGLRAEVKALRDENARLVRRVERVETDLAIRKARSQAPSRPGSPGQGQGSSPGSSVAEIPSLTVVKLKPKVEPPPPLPTSVPVMEPPPEVVEALVSGGAREEPAASYSDDDGPEEEDPALAEQEYDQGLSALRTGNVQGGVERLRQFSRAHPRHARADNALYFSAVGMMGLGDLDGAAATLEAMLREYPAGDAVSDAMLKLAECRIRQSRAPDARSIYSEVIQRYPGTAAASQAEQKLAQLLRTP